jgi:two-component system copper resistance phosphate regulon response regulator CusR
VMRILLVEDDRRLADVLQRSLSEHSHVVDRADNGEDGFELASFGDYDVIILDVLLPRKSGINVARDLRTAGNMTAILMLTARDRTSEIVEGLDSGADDYLVKPFELSELEARLRSLYRRGSANPGKFLASCGISLDLATLRVQRSTREVSLTSREIAFLEFFLRNVDRVLTRAMIEDALWSDTRDSGTSNIIDVYIGRLRAKLSIDGEPQLIHTVRGRGYRFGLP